MEQRMIMVAVIVAAMLFIVISFCIGYVKGFTKACQIDNEILEQQRELIFNILEVKEK